MESLTVERQVVVEGSVRPPEEDSSSGSDSDGEDSVEKAVPAIRSPLRDDSDEDEALEYFGSGAGITNPQTRILPSNTPRAPTIEPSVAQREDKLDEDINLAFDDEGEFGIAFTRQQQAAAAAPAAAVEPATDEDEDDLVLSEDEAPTAPRPSAADDEFDHGGGVGDGNDGAAAEAIRRALAGVEQRDLAESASGPLTADAEVSNAFLAAGNAEFLPSTAACGALYQPVEEPIVAGGGAARGGGVLEAARKALQEVVEVYGGGVGDAEVRLLDAAEGPAPSTARVPLDKSVGVIEEGDEEAEEEEEQREEQKAAEDRLRAAEQTSLLQAAWQQVEATAPPITGGEKTTPPVSAPAQSTSAAVPFESEGGFGAAAAGGFVPMSYPAALRFVQSCDLQQFAALVTVRDPARSSGWFGLGAPKALSYPRCEEDLRFPFLVAQLDCEPGGCAEHLRMLTTLYRALVGGEGALPATGAHWERLGFQGSDPRTDLNRSMKLLSVLQALHLLEAHPAFARQLHALSGSAEAAPSREQQSAASRLGAAPDLSWPFMCVSVMFTKEALTALRSGALNDKCGKRRAVLPTLHAFHHSCFAEFHRLLTEQPAVHHAVHLAALRKTCAASPLKLLRYYKQHYLATTTAPLVASTAKSHPPAAQHSQPPSDGELLTTFDNLESLSGEPRDEGGSAPGGPSVQGGLFASRAQSKAAKFQVS